MNEIQTTRATRLRQLHGIIVAALQATLDKAIEAGGILRDVKAALPHGDFGKWVDENTGFNIRTAQRYMKVFDNRDQLKSDSVSYLNDAHKLLTEPKGKNLNCEFSDECSTMTVCPRLDNAMKGFSEIGHDFKCLSEWNSQYSELSEKMVTIGIEWEVIKNSNSIEDVNSFVKNATACLREATTLTLVAERNLGGVLCEYEKLNAVSGE